MKAIVPMGLTVPASATAFWLMTSRKPRQPNPDRCNRARSRWVLALFLAAVAPDLVAAEARWWMDEPVRLIQTNLRETDSTLTGLRCRIWARTKWWCWSRRKPAVTRFRKDQGRHNRFSGDALSGLGTLVDG